VQVEGVNPEQRTICIDNSASLKSLIALSHEIGHATAFQDMSDEQRERFVEINDTFRKCARYGKSIKKEILNEVLRSERDAWAVAIKLLKPAIKSGLLAKEDLLNYVHSIEGQGLKTYSKAIDRMIEKRLVEN